MPTGTLIGADDVGEENPAGRVIAGKPARAPRIPLRWAWLVCPIGTGRIF